MSRILTTITDVLDRHAGQAVPLIARLGFVLSLGPFFWRSALTKLDGFGLSAGAYVQIVPRLAETNSYNPANLPFWAHLVVGFGTIAEFLLPAMILLGLFSRLSSLAMIGFIAVMTATDIFGHGIEPIDVIAPRILWLAVLTVNVFLGAGAFSLDRAISRNRAI
ncbi:DoxX family protein [Paracoccus albus]|uniref:DoxX family protein n=1 Tax=Paracoccus albus TaxID=3017784 RepID=UPI0022F02F29|nr:DoxX family protein [Paracoccus albus]WBU60915.1 DoxX family protein [Paracoccus albus]